MGGEGLRWWADEVTETSRHPPPLFFLALIQAGAPARWHAALIYLWLGPKPGAPGRNMNVGADRGWQCSN